MTLIIVINGICARMKTAICFEGKLKQCYQSVEPFEKACRNYLL